MLAGSVAHVVVVDNNKKALQDLAQLVQSLGGHVTACNSVKAMFAAIKPLKTAVIFLDVNTDSMDCFEFIPKMLEKSRQVGRRYVVVALSDLSVGPSIALSLAKAGVMTCLKKPVNKAILETTLAEARQELARPVDEPAHIERFVPVRAARESNAPDGADPGAFAPDDQLSPGGGNKTGLNAEATDAVGVAGVHPSVPGGAASASTAPGRSSSAGDGALKNKAPEQVRVVEVGKEAKEGMLHPMDRLTVLHIAPEEPGVITFYDNNEEPLMVEWAANLCQRLCYYVDLHPAMSEIARTARYFQFLATMDRDQEAKAFDRLVNLRGHFPSLMKEAPEGSRHLTPPQGSVEANEPGRITNYGKSRDPRLLEKIKAVLALKPTDPRVQDWLAFTLYSNNMLDEAIEWYTLLITEGSRKEEHFFYCGNAFYKKGNVERAIKLWRIAATINPGSTIAQKSMARLDKAMAGEDPGLTIYR